MTLFLPDTISSASESCHAISSSGQAAKKMQTRQLNYLPICPRRIPNHRQAHRFRKAVTRIRTHSSAKIAGVRSTLGPS